MYDWLPQDQGRIVYHRSLRLTLDLNSYFHVIYNFMFHLSKPLASKLCWLHQNENLWASLLPSETEQDTFLTWILIKKEFNHFKVTHLLLQAEEGHCVPNVILHGKGGRPIIAYIPWGKTCLHLFGWKKHKHRTCLHPFGWNNYKCTTGLHL